MLGALAKYADCAPRLDAAQLANQLATATAVAETN